MTKEQQKTVLAKRQETVAKMNRTYGRYAWKKAQEAKKKEDHK